MRLLVLTVGILAAFSSRAEKMPYERYQTIVDRQMFGPLPPGFDPTKLPSEVQKSSASEKELTQEQEKLQSAVHFSVIDVRPNGEVAVGFTDNSDPKVPRNYFLKVGESRDGWEVKAADPDAATMTIAKGEIEVSLTLGGNSAKDGNATSKADVAPAGRSGFLSFGGRPSGGLLGGSGTLRARRLQRRQQEAAAQEAQAQAAAAKEAERQAQAEQEKQQREQERAEQRQQLFAIQEELKRVREAKSVAKENESGDGSGAENATE